MTKASELIAKLDLQPHPEGGWYKETWRAPPEQGERASGTLIHFLLKSHQSSHWHRVDAAEIWLWHASNPLELSISTPGSSEVSSVLMGPDLTGDQLAQHVIAPHYWQAARPLSGSFDFTLVSCLVSPGFEFSGFTLAPEGWSPDHGTMEDWTA